MLTITAPHTYTYVCKFRNPFTERTHVQLERRPLLQKVFIYDIVVHDLSTNAYYNCTPYVSYEVSGMRFVIRADELLNPNYGRSTAGTEGPVIIPSMTYLQVVIQILW